jgi:ADP-ribose pyrophosphatase
VTGGRQLGTHRIFSGRVVTLDVDEVLEPGSLTVTREVVRHAGSVAVLPVHDDGRVVLVRQYRYPVDAEIWEVPAGRLDSGEQPRDAAKRELEEETGLRAGSLTPFSVYYTSPGFCDEVMHLFRATELIQGPARPEADERIACATLTLEDAVARMRSGEIREAKTLLALLLERELRRSDR